MSPWNNVAGIHTRQSANSVPTADRQPREQAAALDAALARDELTESRIISRHSKQREDCFQKAVIKRGLRRMRRSALRARSLSSP